MRRAVLQVLAFVAVVLGGGALAGGASADPPSPPPGLASQPEVAQAKPTEFRGDVRRIPRGNVVQPEERPSVKTLDESPPSAVTADPALQTATASTPAPAPSNSFAGLDFANWGAGWPPDTNGDVGPTYYVETVNTSIGVFRKSDGAPEAAFTYNTFFGASPTGTPCDNGNGGDPVVLYDSIADRWLVTDFAWTNL